MTVSPAHADPRPDIEAQLRRITDGRRGGTTLHAAAGTGHPDCVRVLLPGGRRTGGPPGNGAAPGGGERCRRLGRDPAGQRVHWDEGYKRKPEVIGDRALG